MSSQGFSRAVVAVGGKPFRLSEEECPGSQHVITSDDVFFLKQLPRRAVVLGGGYIATECASFLAKLGTEVHLLNRSRPLRKYDAQVAEFLVGQFERAGWRLANNARPTRIDRQADGTLTVRYAQVDDPRAAHSIDQVDVVLSAISRQPNLDWLGLQRVPSVRLDKEGRLVGGVGGEQERVGDGVYAVGDCLAGMPELTPVAVKSGRRLASKLERELSGQPPADSAVDLTAFPSTVFCWPEYSFCGLSEEQAVDQCGREAVRCYHSLADLLESSLESGQPTPIYVKIVCAVQADGEERVLGLHFVGANAGEVMQGFAVS